MFKKKLPEKEVIIEKILERDDRALVKYLAKVNSLLKYVTELDYIKDMLIGVNKQTEMIENVAASSEELTASIEDISHFVTDSSSKATSSIDLANESLHGIEDAFKEVQKSFEAAKAVRETMTQVQNEAQKINEMVTIIRSVADQTNLLALNASIEAARAGEQGKGFAVVANEIKKLAENTNEQVNFINETVQSLTDEIENTSKALETSSASFAVGQDKMNTAVSGLDAMHGDLTDINNAFIEISASIEEQTAASQEMSSSIMIVNEENKTLSSEIEKTGRAINSTSNIINEIRMEILNEDLHIDLNTQIEICMCDHLIWRWRVYNMILGYESFTEQEVGTHHTCRLGKWADSNRDNHDFSTIITSMDHPHEDLHTYAKKAIQAYNNGHQEKAEDYLQDIDRISKDVIAHLKKLKKKAR